MSMLWTALTHKPTQRPNDKHAPDASALTLTTLRSSTAAALKRTRRPPVAVAATSIGAPLRPCSLPGSAIGPLLLQHGPKLSAVCT